MRGALLTLAIYAIASMAKAWQRRHGVHWGAYLVSILAISVTFPMSRAIGLVPPEFPTDPLHVFGLFVRALMIFTFIITLIGIALGRLDEQIAATQSALEIAREQQVQILTADEEARRQASLLLHDKVQAGLITACLELRSLSRRLPDAERGELQSMISRLEAMRSIDVRSAARVLSPNLNDIDFATALEELSTQYDSAFQVDLEVDPELDLRSNSRNPQVLLAAYRIIEQALLNAAAHAQAEHVIVAVRRTPSGCDLQVHDDGVGWPPTAVRGLGSTIMTTWTRAMHGTWSVRPGADGRGTVISAHLKDSQARVAETFA